MGPDEVKIGMLMVHPEMQIQVSLKVIASEATNSKQFQPIRDLSKVPTQPQELAAPRIACKACRERETQYLDESRKADAVFQ